MSESLTETRYESDWRLLLSETERARMLDDIGRVALAVGRRQFPDRDWEDLDVAAGSWAARKSPAERLWFIQGLMPKLIETVKHIARAPSMKLVTHARPVSPPVRARRVTAAALLRATRQGRSHQTLEEQTTAPSADTLENRAVKAFLNRLQSDVRALAKMAEAAGEPETAEAARRSARALGMLLAEPWLAAAGSDEAAWRKPSTHRMQHAAGYAQTAQAMRRYRQAFQFDWSHPLFALPARESWRLYETWCLFRVLEALLALGCVPRPGSSGPPLLRVKEDRLAFALTKGEESRLTLAAPDGAALTLCYNPTYSQGTRSLARTLQPDIVVEQEAADGTRTWILDAKFKRYLLPGAEGDDVNQMHAYRDAILDPAGRKSVRRAWCLYAGQADGVNRPLITYGPAPSSIVGALCLRPDDPDGFGRLCALLGTWLRG